MSINNKQIELRTFNTWIHDGICHTCVKPNAIIELDDAKQNTDAVTQLSNGLKYPLLVNLKEIYSISKEARDHFSMQGRSPGIVAIAMLIKSPGSRIIGNFFITLSKPVVPTKLFTEEEKAIKWLQQFKSVTTV